MYINVERELSDLDPEVTRVPFNCHRTPSRPPLASDSPQKSLYGEDSIKENPSIRILALLLVGFLSGIGTITFVDERYIRSDVAAADSALAQAREQITSLQNSNRELSEKILRLEKQLNAADVGAAYVDMNTRDRKHGNETP